MPTKLDRLLKAISPENTLDAVAARVDAAMNSFRVNAQKVETWGWDDLEDCLARFFKHMDQVALAGRPLGLDPQDHLWSHASLLEQEYGAQSYRVVLKIVRSGAEGGLYGVLRALALRLTTKWAENRISSFICEYWKGLSEKEQRAAPREYVDKYGALLPAEDQNNQTLTVRFLPHEFLKEHPRIMQRMRRVGG